jgi:hypothetical protein
MEVNLSDTPSKLKFHKNFFRLLITISLTLQTNPVSHADGVPSFPHLKPASFTMHMDPGFYTMSWLIDKNSQTGSLPPWPLFTYAPIESYAANKENIANIWSEFVLPICKATSDERCVRDVQYRQKNSNSWKSLTFLGYLPVRTAPFETASRDRFVTWADSELDLKQNRILNTNSSRSGLWQLELNGRKTLLMASAQLQYSPEVNLYEKFEIQLTPVSEIYISNVSQYSSLDPETTWCARTGYPDSFFVNNNFHPLTETQPLSGNYDYCLEKDTFPDNLNFRVRAQLSVDLTELQNLNWVASRTSQTRAFLEPRSKNIPALAVFEGFPVTVQVGVTQIPHTLEGFEDFYNGELGLQQAVKSGIQSKDSVIKNFGIGPNYSGGQGNFGYGWSAIQLWRATEKYVNTALTREHSVWNFSVLPIQEEGDSWIEKCGKNQRPISGFNGVVSTNATVFVQTPPKKDASGTLEFQVAATHLKADGSKNLGSYDMSISTELGNCLWGKDFSKAALEFSVIYEDGNKAIESTAISQSNDQIHFTASGFHYSVSEIRVKLNGRATKSTPSSATTSSQKLKLITIKCKSKNLVRKVSGVNPKCPRGFQKTM